MPYICVTKANTMTNTTQQADFLNRNMNAIVNQVIAGIDPIEAVKNELRREFDFCGEMAMIETDRAKLAFEYAANKVFTALNAK